MKMRTMKDLYAHLLRDMYYAENQLIKILPKLAKLATHPGLKTGLQDHLLETKVQAERIEQLFKQLNLPVRGEKCLAMDGLIAEAKETVDNAATDIVRDAAIIAACRKVEHYEAGSYRTLIEIAKLLGKDDQLKILRNILKEEKAADAELAELAVVIIRNAAQAEVDTQAADSATETTGQTSKKPVSSPKPAAKKTVGKTDTAQDPA